MLKRFSDLIQYSNKTKNAYNFEICATQLCNMRCEYCFEDENTKRNPKQLDAELIKKRIKEVLDSDFLKGFDALIVDFWGGEPTLNMSLIEEIIWEFWHRPDVYFHIYSNGYKVDRLLEISKYLIDKGCGSSFDIQFSYDGYPIHDMRRKSIEGEPTSKTVLENAKKAFEIGTKLHFKSTITPTDFKYLPEIWDDFKKLNEAFGVGYMPTIDVYKEYDHKKHLKELEIALLEVAKKEVSFIKQNGEPLLKWLKSERNLCTAGENGFTVDVDGKIYLCHGCLYSKEKKNSCVTSIYDDNFLDKVVESRNRLIDFDFSESIKECNTNCIASYCIRCNAKKLDHSEKETFTEKWFDFTCQPFLCDYFRLIGKIEIAMRKVIKGG